MVNYMEQLQEALEDENIVVTYKWLSLTFGISANSAKKVLQDFLDSKPDQEKVGFTVTYCFYGIPYDSLQSLTICLAKKEQKEAIEKKFVRVIGSHVYSISKNSESVSTQIYNSDSDLISKNLSLLNNYSSVLSNALYNSNPRSLVVNGKQKENVKQAVIEKANEIPNRKQDKGIKAAKVENAGTTDLSEVERKPSIQRKESEAVAESPLNKAKVQKKSSGIALMFQKQSSKSSLKGKEVGEKVKDEPLESRDQVSKDANIQIEEKTKEPLRETKLSKPCKSKVSKSRKKKCVASGDEESPIPKKRKRVIIHSDSSDSEPEAEHIEDEEDIIPPPLSSNTEHISIQSEASKTKKRTTKWVDKTYLDEDGFIVTKKELEHVDESDEDKRTPQESSKSVQGVKTEAVKDKKNSSPSKPPMKKKQSSIISFFQKK
ncbi:DNA polymerase delta subunit 3-like [Artemia franciscana]|uniref:DNA polymerase delta subunit 3 n=1 Tax=Artemia franciscana TaxID=6661 RepID=A0AA88I4J0_ARTSF|nr:hypothetical protein QYM36_010055 [Artemia franciscana]